MKISRDQLRNAAATYCRLPTSKREIPSASVQRLAHRALRMFLEHYPQEEFPRGNDLLLMIKDWLAQSTHSRITRYKYAKTLVAILKEQYYIDAVSGSDLTRRFFTKSDSNWSEKALSDAQLETIFNRLDDFASTQSGLKHYMAICIMLFTGSRIAAALAAKDYALSSDDISFYIPRQKSKIIEDIRKTIPLDIVMPNGKMFREIAERYVSMRESKMKPSVYLFPGKNGDTAGQLALRNFISKLNLPFHLIPHALRHTAGTLTAERVGVLEATRLLDHSSITITQKYIKRITGDSKKSIMQVWSRPTVAPDPAHVHGLHPDMQEAIDKFHKDAAKLSALVSTLTDYSSGAS